MSEAVDEIPWGHLGETWWRDCAAEDPGTTEQHLKLAVCRAARMTLEECARIAGYKGDADGLRKAGSAAAKGLRVKRLISLAQAELKSRNLPNQPQPLLSNQEMQERLSEFARSKNAQTAMRAMESLQKLEERSKLNDEIGDDFDGLNDFRIMRNMMQLKGGAAAALAVYTSNGFDLASVPLLRDCIGFLKLQAPDYWEHLRRKQHPGDLATLDRLLNDPDWQRVERKKVWREVGRVIEAGEAWAPPRAEHQTNETSNLGNIA